MTQSNYSSGSSSSSPGQVITGLARGAGPWILILGLLFSLPLGCQEDEWYNRYLERPLTIGKVWAVDGETFYVAAGNSVIVWEEGMPARVIYLEQKYVTDLWGTGRELRAVIVEGDLRLKDGSAWRRVPSVSGHSSAVWGEGNDVYVAPLRLTENLFSSPTSIFRLHEEEWTLEAELEPMARIVAIRGNSDTGLWAAGNRLWEELEQIYQLHRPVLLRRGMDGWETADSTHFGEAFRSFFGGTPVDPVGDVYAVTDLWVDPQGRANVVHWGEGILVHDGTESWMEPTPVPADHRIRRVSISPDGTLYAVARSRDSTDEAAVLWIRDSAGWRSHSLGSDLYPKGLSAYEGGAIMTATSLLTWSEGRTGKVFRILPDGTITLLGMMPLED